MNIVGEVSRENCEYYRHEVELTAAVKRYSERADFAVVKFEAIRELEGKSSEEWPDGFIHQAAVDLGLGVEL